MTRDGVTDVVRSPPKPRTTALEPGTAERLRDWFATALGARDVLVADLHAPDANGTSSTILIARLEFSRGGRRQSQRLVIRVQTTDNVIYPNADFTLPFRICERLTATTTLPIPRVLWLEMNTDVLGAPFYVMEYAEGRAPPDNPPYNLAGWVAEATPPERESIWWSGVKAMADIHATDWRAAGLNFLQKASDAHGELAHEINYYRDFYALARDGVNVPVIERAFRYIDRHTPRESLLRLCWGDARLGNLLFRNGECTAILDWEMVSLGAPEKDIGYWLQLDSYNSFGDMPRLEGWPSHEETVERYQSWAGYRLENLEFYKLFASLRGAVIYTRFLTIWRRQGHIENLAAALGDNPVMRLLEEAIDVAERGR